MSRLPASPDAADDASLAPADTGRESLAAERSPADDLTEGSSTASDPLATTAAAEGNRTAAVIGVGAAVEDDDGERGAAL